MKTLYLTISIIFFHLFSYGEIDTVRQFQLDSITTNISKNVVRDLDSVHAYLDSKARNDEEKVWMYYGLIAIHFKYDYHRKGEKNRPDYSPAYTAKRLSGVCEDFAKLFKELCDKSHIPCLVTIGKAKIGILAIFETVQKIVRFQSLKSNHAWNVVKINSVWQLMDPTWSHVIKVHKKVLVTGKTKKNVNIKIVDRKYYQINPFEMGYDHKTCHPAFLTLNKVPTFKSEFRKVKRQKTFMNDYDYTSKLDSIYACKYPMLSKTYTYGCTQYIKRSMLQYEIQRQLLIPFRKEAVPLTINDYEQYLQQVNELSEFLMETYQYDLGSQKTEYEEKVKKKIEKLKKTATMKK